MATAVTSTDDAAQIPEPIPCAYPPAKPPACVYDKIITVAVGPDDAKKKFKIYRGLLCHFSSYFDRMLNGSFKEGGSTYLRLKDIDAETFNVFYYWLNAGVLDWSNSGGRLNWEKVINAYVFADFHQAPIFRNAVLESLFNGFIKDSTISLWVTEVLYTKTCEGDSMRKLIVDIVAATGDFDRRYRDYITSAHKDFLVDMLMAFEEQNLVPGQGRTNNGFAWLDEVRNSFCQRYHTHREGEASQGDFDSCT